MIRQIIHINQELCNGCGACAQACHENAIGMVDGKARLLRDDYCDGLGDCLPACPTGAITFEQREAADYDAAATEAHRQSTTRGFSAIDKSTDGSITDQANKPVSTAAPANIVASTAENAQAAPLASKGASQLHNWPIQIKLSPIHAPAFDNADLLIAADCTAYAYASFHQDFMSGKTVLMGCPKLDGVNYADKLTQIFEANSIKSITLTRMEVPCCGGLEFAIKQAIEACGKALPLNVVTIGITGNVLE